MTGRGLAAPVSGALFQMLAIGVALSVFAAGLTLSGLTERFDNVVYDALLRASPRTASKDIAIVAIDDRSLKALGPWPWPHRIHAQMLEELARARPKAILYDVLFIGPSAAPDDDARLAPALKASGRVFAPLLFRTPGDNGRAYELIAPIPALSGARGLGHADVRPDQDGVVRRIDLALDGEKRWLHVAALAAEGAPAADGRIAALPRFAPRSSRSPLRRRGETRVAFGGPSGARFPTYAFIDVLNGRARASLGAGDYILVGATAASLSDQYSTPIVGDASVMPGVELQASVLDTLVHGLAVSDASPAVQILLSTLAVWLLMGLYLRAPTALVVPLWAASGIVVLLVSGGLLFIARIWAPPTATLAAIVLAQPLWAWGRLDAASRYMVAELSRLSQDRDIASAPPPGPRAGQDRIARQIELLGETVARVRSLRSLVSAAVQSLPDPTVLVDLGGDIVMANTAAVALFGGRGGVTPADVERFFSAPARPSPAFDPPRLTSVDAPWNMERTGVDGSIRDVRCVSWLGEAGAPIGWIVRFSDVTAVRLAERRREETLQLLTHDMRSPQASILALIAQNAGALSAPLSERLSRYALRTIALADGFLHLARADAGGYRLRPTNLSDLVIEALDDLWPQSSARNIAVATVGLDDEILVNGEPSLLTRTLINLIGNAVKFSPDGRQVTCGLRREGQGGDNPRVVFWVTDEGPGLSADAQAGLFSRFRPRSTDERRVEGVGLGLAFVHSVITQHGGTVACQSEPGRGATFEVALPPYVDAP